MKPKFDIFVFGSNLQGRHGKGAALTAHKTHGAVRGVGEGLTGKSYALPTKKTPYITLSIEDIERGVHKFLNCARENTHLDFYVVEVGCGLAGYVPAQIAPLFKGYSNNVLFNPRFDAILNPTVINKISINSFMKKEG